MADHTTFEIDTILYHLGQAGSRLAEIGAAEGAAGNISVCLRKPLDAGAQFHQEQDIELPHAVPELAGMMLIVSGSGRRLREIAESPLGNLACVIVHSGGRTGTLRASSQRQFQRVTSEFNSHLGVHADRMRSTDVGLHAVIHAQPVHLTHLSHLQEYQDEKTLSRRLLRWQPEAILNMPEGIGVVPFLLPGSAQLVVETKLSLRTHRIVIWARHGVMARADNSILHASDLIEYAETAAHYETLNRFANAPGGGLSAEEIREIAKSWNVAQSVF
ncbi:MAG TPA: class II aldolase/adducin family protein [Anaerolineales bacterium]|nr:class II aldolase/adducin family protein [Anaerolineales bacterium]HMR99749.1 class II aldolase/adducin family protein [Anaerolineales bacterium]HNQ93767.1 class II aldolase/adducin family protein [Anaerolineales bacterium]HNS60514.1 class II aldolase/adducin family protein [Anaerolineales bacterium]